MSEREPGKGSKVALVLMVLCGVLFSAFTWNLYLSQGPGIGWNTYPGVSVTIFLSGFGFFSSLSALLSPKKGSFMLRGFLLFLLLAVLLALALSLRDVFQVGAYDELSALVGCFTILLVMIGGGYTRLRRKEACDRPDL